MAMTRDLKERVDASISHIHDQFGETVYVRRLVESGADPVYNEDMTRVEGEFRALAIVNIDVPRRTLDRFGVTTPIDLMVTFSKDQLNAAGLDYIYKDDVIVWRNIRHTVVQVNEVPKAVIDDGNDTNDVESEFVELATFALVSAVPEPNVVPTPQPHDPTAAAAFANPSFEFGTTGWDFSPTADASTLRANDGVRSYHQVATAPNQFTTQDLTGKLVPGKTYTLDSEAFALSSIPTLKVKVGTDEYKVEGEPGWINDGTWHRMPQLSFTAPAADVPVTVSIGQGDSTTPGEFFVDSMLLDVPTDPNVPQPDPGSVVPSPVSSLQSADFLVGQYTMHLVFNKDVELVGSPAIPLRVTVNHDLAYFGGITQVTPRQLTILIDRLFAAGDEVLVYYSSERHQPIQNGIVLASDPTKEIADFAGVQAGAK